MNASAFATNPNETYRAIGIGFGIMIPVMIFFANMICARQVQLRATLGVELAALAD